MLVNISEEKFESVEHEVIYELLRKNDEPDSRLGLDMETNQEQSPPMVFPADSLAANI
jgi:hypothetical protein